HGCPSGADEREVRARVADGREEREIALGPVHLPELRGVHRAPSPFDHLIGREALLPQTPELAEARLEDPGHALRRLVARYLPVERREVAAGPEAFLELVRAADRALQH